MNSCSYFFLLWLFYSYHYKEQLARWVLIRNTYAYGEFWLLIKKGVNTVICVRFALYQENLLKEKHQLDK